MQVPVPYARFVTASAFQCRPVLSFNKNILPRKYKKSRGIFRVGMRFHPVVISMPYKDHNMRKKVWRDSYWNYPLKRVYKLLKRKDKDSTVTIKELFSLAHRQRLICPLSGRRLTNENISADHIVHRSSGGKTEIGNIRLVSKEINYARHLLTDAEFVKLCQDVVNTYMSHNGQ